MKRSMILLALAVMSLFVADEAFAVSFSADVPLSYTFSEKFLDAAKSSKPKDTTVTDTSGYLLSATWGYLGVGYEAYQVNAASKFVPGQGPAGVSSVDFAMHVHFYDLFLDLPLPLLNVSLGVGKGRMNAELDPVQGQVFHVEGADASQSFVRIGIPIAHFFDLHLGYNQVHIEDAKVPNAGGGPGKLRLSGNLLTAGVRVGW